MGLTLLSGAATLMGILAADLTYALADPRIRRG
jgi:ABC-type dipeptide/oligopeptide/nickel transport system permease component